MEMRLQRRENSMAPWFSAVESGAPALPAAMSSHEPHPDWENPADDRAQHKERAPRDADALSRCGFELRWLATVAASPWFRVAQRTVELPLVARIRPSGRPTSYQPGFDVGGWDEIPVPVELAVARLRLPDLHQHPLRLGRAGPAARASRLQSGRLLSAGVHRTCGIGTVGRCSCTSPASTPRSICGSTATRWATARAAARRRSSTSPSSCESRSEYGVWPSRSTATATAPTSSARTSGGSAASSEMSFCSPTADLEHPRLRGRWRPRRQLHRRPIRA